MTLGRAGAALVAALLLVAGTVGARAGEANTVAERGGFLLGNALRCGVAERRLEPTARLMHAYVAALAADAEEQATADRVFAARVTAAASPAGRAAADCAQIRRKVAEFEHHVAARPALASAPGAAAAMVMRAATRSGAPSR